MNSRDAKRYAALRELGCIACLLNGTPQLAGNVEINHLVDKGYRKHSGGNQATIPLCVWHHRGEPPMDFTVRYMREIAGPSMFHEGKAFTERYGTQRQLLGKVNEMLRIGKRGIAT